MSDAFEKLPALLMGLVVLGGLTGTTMLCGMALSRFVPREVRMQHNDLAGFILAVVGVVYAVLLAFVAIGVWERFEQAEVRTYEEAGMLTVVYRDAGSFPDQRDPIRAQVHAYVEALIHLEWPAMQRGDHAWAARRDIEALDAAVRALPASTPRLQNIQSQMLGAMDTALADRDDRVSMSATGISGVMWLVLAIGAVVTVGFTYLFGFQRTAIQQIMIGALSLTIGLVLFLCLALDYPFRGGVTVSPDAFENALRVFTFIHR